MQKWQIRAKELDAHVLRLADLAHDPRIRDLEPVVLPGSGQLDAYSSAFARAYRVRDGNETFRCLRFWLQEPDPNVVQVYQRLREIPALVYGYLPRAELISSALSISDLCIPVVLMDWVNGDNLAEAITANLDFPNNLLRIAEEIRYKFIFMNKHNISHGDLRASNILINTQNYSFSTSFIDLDSVRWSDGPTGPRIGGNPEVAALWLRDKIDPLDQDHMDQALAYLVIVAVALDNHRWPGSTDGFLSISKLRGETEDIWAALEGANGHVGEIAKTVRGVRTGTLSWRALASTLLGDPERELTGDEFWARVFRPRVSRTGTTSSVKQERENGSDVSGNGRGRWKWLGLLILIGILLVLLFIFAWL